MSEYFYDWSDRIEPSDSVRTSSNPKSTSSQEPPGPPDERGHRAVQQAVKASRAVESTINVERCMRWFSQTHDALLFKSLSIKERFLYSSGTLAFLTFVVSEGIVSVSIYVALAGSMLGYFIFGCVVGFAGMASFCFKQAFTRFTTVRDSGAQLRVKRRKEPFAGLYGERTGHSWSINVSKRVWWSLGGFIILFGLVVAVEFMAHYRHNQQQMIRTYLNGTQDATQEQTYRFIDIHLPAILVVGEAVTGVCAAILVMFLMYTREAKKLERAHRTQMQYEPDIVAVAQEWMRYLDELERYNAVRQKQNLTPHPAIPQTRHMAMVLEYCFNRRFNLDGNKGGDEPDVDEGAATVPDEPLGPITTAETEEPPQKKQTDPADRVSDLTSVVDDLIGHDNSTVT